ncbi:TauD/TfdA family dioxygenase [Rhodospirillales bacterium]|jgi:taurine dioxygenase|nr:TauD/TfdA family dioxygenase [Rhodospirillales bacterium]MDC1214594.1 TauD/TfdA family dioxygenase [Rhodospirillales bacterium]
MSQSSHTIRKLSSSFGIEISGIDLSKDISAMDQMVIRELWAKHQLLLFRGQSLREEDLVRTSRYIGDLEIHIRREYLSDENPEILLVSNIKKDGRSVGILSDTEVGWHYDQIYLPRPAVGSMLMAVKLPSSGGQTSFADMTAAFEALPDEIKSKINGTKAVQSYEAFNAQFSVTTNKTQKKLSPDIEQPLVRTHPISGRKALYICPGMTTQIVGMDAHESAEMLDYLFDFSVRPKFVYTHNWQMGDVLLWDNASTMHRREPFDGNDERLMKRTTILPPEDLAVPF